MFALRPVEIFCRATCRHRVWSNNPHRKAITAAKSKASYHEALARDFRNAKACKKAAYHDSKARDARQLEQKLKSELPKINSF